MHKNMKEQKDVFDVYTWPEVKYYMQFNDFLENAVPITDYPLIKEYGGSAFLVRRSWIAELNQNKINFSYE